MSSYELTYEHLIGFCQRQSFQHARNDELRELAVLYRVLDREAPLLLIPRPERGMLTLAITLPVQVPPARAPEVTAALGLLNASAYMGAWVLLQARGEPAFRITIPASLDDAQVLYNDAALLHVARLVVSTVETYASAIAQVAAGAAPDSVLAPGRAS